MSIANISDISQSQTSGLETTKTKNTQNLSVEITFLVISIIVFCVGLALLVTGITQPSLILLSVGAILLLGGLLGIVCASLLIRLEHRRKQLLVEDTESPVIKSLQDKLSEKQDELEGVERRFNDFSNKYLSDIRQWEASVTHYNQITEKLEGDKRIIEEKNEQLLKELTLLKEENKSLQKTLKEESSKGEELLNKLEQQQRLLRDKDKRLNHVYERLIRANLQKVEKNFSSAKHGSMDVFDSSKKSKEHLKVSRSLELLPSPLSCASSMDGSFYDALEDFSDETE